MTIRERIEDTLETIRPALHIDGGDVEFVDFEDGVVQLRLVGADVLGRGLAHAREWVLSSIALLVLARI